MRVTSINRRWPRLVIESGNSQHPTVELAGVISQYPARVGKIEQEECDGVTDVVLGGD